MLIGARETKTYEGCRTQHQLKKNLQIQSFTMPVKRSLTGSRVPVKILTDDIDEKEQLRNIASLPFVHHHVAAMPGVHLGIGATIGSGIRA